MPSKSVCQFFRLAATRSIALGQAFDLNGEVGKRGVGNFIVHCLQKDN